MATLTPNQPSCVVRHTQARPSTGDRMPARWASSRGLSLVEVTIMLVILLILAGTLVPVMSDTVNSARSVRARNDLSQLAAAIVNFQRDVGPVVFDGGQLRQRQPRTSSLRPVLVLTSEGDYPEVTDRVPVETVDAPLIDPAMSLDGSTVQAWTTREGADLLDLHLRVNGRGYTEARGSPGTGWNGPYVSKAVPGDPWGHAYLINVGFMRGLPDSVSPCSRCAVFAISAGQNGIIETPFRQPIANAHVFGDDLAVRIQ